MLRLFPTPDREIACTLRRSRAVVVLCLLTAALGGCASTNDSMGSAFVDPAKYNLFDCKQLAPAHADALKRETELAALMAKAEQGTAGPLMAELGYRTDYQTARGQREQIEMRQRELNCPANLPVTTQGPLVQPIKPKR